jgi:hypothetical protein
MCKVYYVLSRKNTFNVVWGLSHLNTLFQNRPTYTPYRPIIYNVR